MSRHCVRVQKKFQGAESQPMETVATVGVRYRGWMRANEDGIAL